MMKSLEKTIAVKKQICCACDVDDFNFFINNEHGRPCSAR